MSIKQVRKKKYEKPKISSEKIMLKEQGTIFASCVECGASCSVQGYTDLQGGGTQFRCSPC